MITTELNLWLPKVVRHSPKNVPTDESGVTRQAHSNTPTAGRAASKLTGTTYEHLRYGNAASEQKPVGSNITYCIRTMWPNKS